MSHRTLKSRRRLRPPATRLRLVTLEDRLAPAIYSWAGNAQHTNLSPVQSQPLQATHWEAPIDDFFNQSFGHYGAPLATDANTIIYPHKTGIDPPEFHVVARNGNDGTQVWDVATDWEPSTFNWFPPYQPVLATATNRVYFAGAGGTLYYRSNPDSPTGTVTQVAFYGTLAHYNANKATYDSRVFVDTPLTADSQGNIFFGFRVHTGGTPTNLVSGIARIAPDGTATRVSAETAANGDTGIDQAARYSAPALSNDESTLYLGVKSNTVGTYGRLVGLNATTLATQFVSGVLKDPRNGGANNASLLTDSTSSPMVAPDGTVYFGVMSNPGNGSRGWMLHYSANLQTQFTPGGFGWDNTPSIVPASMVPQYTGSSTYLLFSKYNNYYTGPGGDGDGTNMIAILDPYDSEVDFHSSSNGLSIMKRVLFKVGPTLDVGYPAPAVREWCINTAAVDPATSSVIVNSSDGKYYRWHLPTNSLSESMVQGPGILQPYTGTVIGTDGTMFGVVSGVMQAFGKTPGLSVSDVTVANNGTSAVFTVSLDFPRTAAITVNYATANGSALAGTHYTTTSGSLTYNAGQKSKTVTVPIAPGSVTGTSATFFLNLTSPANADLLDAQGVATIQGQPPQVQDFDVNDGTAQRSIVDSLTLTFNGAMDFAGAVANAFSLTRNGGTAVNFAATANLVGGVTVVTLDNFGGSETENGSLRDGRYTLTANALQISSGGQFLNGGTNVVYGEAEGLYRFYGDVNGDRRVDISDFGFFSAAYLQGSAANNPALDFNGDGRIDISDFGQFSLRYFTNLP